MQHLNSTNQNQLSIDIPIWYLSEREIQLLNEMLNDTTLANPELQQFLALGESPLKSNS